MNRRDFLKTSADVGLKAAVTSSLLHLPHQKAAANTNLLDGTIKIPEGFNYKLFSRTDEIMSDGEKVPSRHDGMACFEGHLPGISYVLVRNHEEKASITGSSPFPKKAWDKKTEGGTTTIFLDQNLNVVDHFMSLTGTLRNCSGGKTPWNTWVSCEESITKPLSFNPRGPLDTFYVQKAHGYAFEIDPYASTLQSAKPLKKMGRFRREAVAIDETTGICYQSEDEWNGCFYRFIPSIPGDLDSDGKLQVLGFVDRDLNDTSNGKWSVGDSNACTWIDLEDPDPANRSLKSVSHKRGAAKFRAGEGLAAFGSSIFFAASGGGKLKRGQIFEYNSTGENTGNMKLVFEVGPAERILNPDQLTHNQWGDMIVCEDTSDRDCRIVGITPDGRLYDIAENDTSEWTGVCWSPDQRVLFANVQKPGVTVAIWGDWESLRNQSSSRY